MEENGELSELEKTCLWLLFNIQYPSIDYELDINQLDRHEEDPEDIVIKWNIIEKMSQDAQDVLEIICLNPQLVDVFCNGGRIDQKKFIVYLKNSFKDDKGKYTMWNWTISRTKRAFNEVRKALKEMIT
jgi:hypothetical protein